jgi:hypothetical protein
MALHVEIALPFRSLDCLFLLAGKGDLSDNPSAACAGGGAAIMNFEHQRVQGLRHECFPYGRSGADCAFLIVLQIAECRGLSLGDRGFEDRLLDVFLPAFAGIRR